MDFINSKEIFLPTVLASSLFSFIIAILFLVYRNTREMKYNEKLHRAEIEMLRSSLEGKIYGLTERLTSKEERWLDTNHTIVSYLKNIKDETTTIRRQTLTSFLKQSGVSESDLEIQDDFVFVLTPFHQRFEETYESISKACREIGLVCSRGDEQQISGDLMPHILRNIVKARIIIANVDGRNANVFYELGISHGLDKQTIIVTSGNPGELEVDLRTKKLIVHSSPEELVNKLQKELARSVVKLK